MRRGSSSSAHLVSSSLSHLSPSLHVFLRANKHRRQANSLQQFLRRGISPKKRATDIFQTCFSSIAITLSSRGSPFRFISFFGAVCLCIVTATHSPAREKMKRPNSYRDYRTKARSTQQTEPSRKRRWLSDKPCSLMRAPVTPSKLKRNWRAVHLWPQPKRGSLLNDKIVGGSKYFGLGNQETPCVMPETYCLPFIRDRRTLYHALLL